MYNKETLTVEHRKYLIAVAVFRIICNDKSYNKVLYDHIYLYIKKKARSEFLLGRSDQNPGCFQGLDPDPGQPIMFSGYVRLIL